MKMSKIIFTKIFICSSIAWLSQINICKAQPVDNRTLFDQAEDFLLNENYEKALPLFENLLISNPNNANWNFKIGFCYLNSPVEVSKSVTFLERAAANTSSNSRDDSFKEDKAPLFAILYLGDSYHRNFRFDEAIETYNRFKKLVPEKDKAMIATINHRIEVCNNAKAFVASPVNMYIKNLGNEINSPYADYSPIVSADETVLLFTSRRPENVGEKTADDGKFFEDIYIAYKGDDDENWGPAKNIGPPINTEAHEATIGTSVDGQIVFIYKDDIDSGSIYLTSMQGETWTMPEKIGGDVNSKHWESHATLSADGNTLYFVSNRPGGFGGRDIYRCKKLPNGQWSKAMNLGHGINTPYEEDSPFLQPGSNNLYFSSQGHKSMGGFDIFFSHPIDTGIYGGWSEPENMGYPVNTPGDDIFYVPTIDNKRAYYSSFAQGSIGDKDIFMMTLPEREESKLTVMRGTMLDDFGKVPTGAMITITDPSNGDIVGNYQPNPKNGRYIFILPHSKTYNISYEADDFHTVTNSYKVAPGKEYLSTEMVLLLKDVRLEKKTLGTVGISGTVSDIQKKIVKNALITVKDNATGATAGSFSSDNQGKFSFVLERGKNYNLAFEAEGYLFQTENVNLPKEMVYSTVEKNIVLQPIVAGSKIVLNNLFFDFNKSKLRKESFIELDKAYKLLKEKNNITIEVSGHTDNKGDDKLNNKLSADRAKAVMDYFIKKGIDKKRLSYKGYGKTQPVATNDTDEGRQLNRRVELKILAK